MRQHYPIFTADIVTDLGNLLRDKKVHHVFLVHGKHSYVACGAKDVVDAVQKQLQFQLTEFVDFSENPKEEDAQAGLQLLLETKPDVIIAIGGGSAIDTAKLIRHEAVKKKLDVPLIAIPTTAGTGAEATHFAVVYMEGVKHSEEAEDIQPDVAILYAPFTYRNNEYLTACTGFDALAQAIEAFWSPFATDESDVYALRAISYVHNSLPKLIENPSDTHLRSNILRGAYWAGRAINITKTTAPHAFSYAFTTHCGYPHGHAVAITFPFFAKLNMQDHVKNEKLRMALRLDNNIDLLMYFKDYVQRIGLQYAGTHEENLGSLLAQVNTERMKNNPVLVSENVVMALRLFIEKLPINAK